MSKIEKLNAYSCKAFGYRFVYSRGQHGDEDYLVMSNSSGEEGYGAHPVNWNFNKVDVFLKFFSSVSKNKENYISFEEFKANKKFVKWIKGLVQNAK